MRCGVPTTTADDWKTEDEGTTVANPKHLCELSSKLEKSDSPNIHAVVLVRDGALIYEHYRNGSMKSGGSGLEKSSTLADRRHDVRSISKSVVSLLVGIAVDRGLIESVENRYSRSFRSLLRCAHRKRIASLCAISSRCRQE